MFNAVELDPTFGTPQWQNGADLEPADATRLAQVSRRARRVRASLGHLEDGSSNGGLTGNQEDYLGLAPCFRIQSASAASETRPSASANISVMTSASVA